MAALPWPLRVSASGFLGCDEGAADEVVSGAAALEDEEEDEGLGAVAPLLPRSFSYTL